MASVPLAEAEAQLSALIERVEAGETVEITRSGKPVARLVAASSAKPRVKPDWAALDALVARQQPQPDSGEFVRQMRDDYRY